MHILAIKGEIEIEKYYIWLSMIYNMSEDILRNLLKVFNSVENLYKISKTQFLFKQLLLENNLFISDDIYLKLIDLNLKQKSKLLYEKLKNSKIKMLNFNDKQYKDIFYFYKNYSKILFYVGNLELLKNKNKVMLYYNREITTSYIKIIYNDFSGELKNQKFIQVEFLSNLSNIDNHKIYILDFIINNQSIDIIKKIDIKSSLILFTVNNFNMNHKDFNLLLISSIVNKLILLEASYNLQNVKLVDNILDMGKDIYVVPGNILSKSNYFSNYLIKQGANVIISKNDIKDI